MHFNTIVGWQVRTSKVVEQYKKMFKDTDDDIFDVGKCIHSIAIVIENSDCPIEGIYLERHEERKTNGTLILTIYDDPKPPRDGEIKEILSKFPPIFDRIKRDLDIVGDPKTFLKEP